MPRIWKDTAIKLLSGGEIRLSMRNNQKPIAIQMTLTADTKIRQDKLVYEEVMYYLHFLIEMKNVARKTTKRQSHSC